MANQAQDVFRDGGVRTEIRRHPEKYGWAIFAVVTGPLGAVLFISHDSWILRESAEFWQLKVLDPAIDEALQKLTTTDRYENIFDAVEDTDLLRRIPTKYHPKQFESL